jgi:hypothetical protein
MAYQTTFHFLTIKNNKKMSKTTQSSADAKRAYAQNLIAQAKARGIENPVIVLPEYDEESGTLLDNCVVPSPNSTKGMGYIALFQSRVIDLRGVEFDNDLWCLQRGRVASLETRYQVGQILEGHIVVEDTLVPPNENNLEQDLKFKNRACLEAGIPCEVKGKFIYQIKYLDKTGTVKDTTIAHDNEEELIAITNGAKSASAKPFSKGVANAGAKAAGRKPMPTE